MSIKRFAQKLTRFLPGKREKKFQEHHDRKTAEHSTMKGIGLPPRRFHYRHRRPETGHAERILSARSATEIEHHLYHLEVLGARVSRRTLRRARRNAIRRFNQLKNS